MATLFTFPGQGSQRSGMLKSVYNQETKHLFTSASDILGFDVFDIDNDLSLKNNQNTQIAMTLCAIASAEMLIHRNIMPDYVLGLSIGAFSAVVVAGIISFEEGIRLVSLRGKLMSDAYPTDYGMAAIIGLSTQKTIQLIAQVASSTDAVYLANINTESQHIISGSLHALTVMCELAKKHQARSAKLIKVNVPSHCQLLTTQADQLLEAMAHVTFNRPTITYVSANRARTLFDPDIIKKDLALNMANQIQWWQTTEMLAERGVKLAVELSPGSVLTNLSKISMVTTQCLSFDNNTINTLKSLYER